MFLDQETWSRGTSLNGVPPPLHECQEDGPGLRWRTGPSADEQRRLLGIVLALALGHEGIFFFFSKHTDEKGRRLVLLGWLKSSLGGSSRCIRGFCGPLSTGPGVGGEMPHAMGK